MGNNSVFAKKKFQKGLSLIEASMVLVLSAVVVAGVMVYYQSAQDNNKMEQTLSQTLSLVGGVNGLYAGQSNYNGLDTATVAQSGAIPDSAIDTSTTGVVKIVNGFGTNTDAYGISVNDLKKNTGAGAVNDGYTLVLRKLTKSQCTKVSSQKINGSLVGTAVISSSDWDASKALPKANTSSKTAGYVDANLITPAVMAGMCGTVFSGNTTATADVVFVLK